MRFPARAAGGPDDVGTPGGGRWCTALPATDLPADWRNEPIPPSTQAVGETWLREGETLALQVPSAVVPPETNVAINPHHPDFDRITVGDPHPVGFDARIWQGS